MLAKVCILEEGRERGRRTMEKRRQRETNVDL